MRQSTAIRDAVRRALVCRSGPLAVIVCGHNGSGKSTLWNSYLVNQFRVPLLNADRVMMSLMPESRESATLPAWARRLRDDSPIWMGISQRGVEALMAQAMQYHAAFAFETVFSYWQPMPDGSVRSKVDLIHRLHEAGYFVLLLFVGLSNAGLSVGRVLTRSNAGGHSIAYRKLIERFSRTQQAVKQALNVADAAILFDNSGTLKQAFTPVQIRSGSEISFDARRNSLVPASVASWLDVVSPM